MMANLDLISIIDVESTGLTPATDEVIELGCILYSLSHNTVLQQVSTLVAVGVDVNPVEHINGISAGSAHLVQAPDDNSVLHSALSMCLRADAFVAHKAQFDRNFLECFINAHDYSYDYPLLSKPWIDSMAITWPRATRQGCSLRDLAGDYSIPVWKPHRALTDCILLSEILQAEPRAKELLEKELEPKVWATWASTPRDKAGHARAKASGLRWNQPECPAKSVWSRLMHEDDIQQLPFEVVTMEVAAHAN